MTRVTLILLLFTHLVSFELNKEHALITPIHLSNTDNITANKLTARSKVSYKAFIRNSFLNRMKGELVMAGTELDRGSKLWIGLYDISGIPRWDRKILTRYNGKLNSVIAFGKSSYIAVGQMVEDSESRGVIIVFDNTGRIERWWRLKPQTVHGKTHTIVELKDIIPIGDGGYIVVGGQLMIKYNKLHSQVDQGVIYQKTKGAKSGLRPASFNGRMHKIPGSKLTFFTFANSRQGIMSINSFFAQSKLVELKDPQKRESRFHTFYKDFYPYRDNGSFLTGRVNSRVSLTRIDHSGRVIWSKTFPSSSEMHDTGHSITKSGSGFLLSGHKDHQSWLAWFRPNGNIAFSSHLGIDAFNLKDIHAIHSIRYIATDQHQIIEIKLTDSPFHSSPTKPQESSAINIKSQPNNAPCKTVDYRIYKTEKIQFETNQYTQYIECYGGPNPGSHNFIIQIKGPGGSYLYGASQYSTEKEAARAACGCS